MSHRLEEALRYLGAKGAIPETLREQTAAQLEQLASAHPPRGLYRLYRVQHTPEGVVLLDAQGVAVLTLPGQLARRMLETCRQAALIVCTLGAGFDASLRTQQVRDMAQYAIANACGSALVEEGCDRLEQDIAKACPGLYLTDRFSPGYGDLPLTLQPVLLHALDAQRRIGVSVTESCLMFPQKTVTAIIGLSENPQQAKIRGCAYCRLKNTCTLRKDGKRCDSF